VSVEELFDLSTISLEEAGAYREDEYDWWK